MLDRYWMDCEVCELPSLLTRDEVLAQLGEDKLRVFGRDRILTPPPKLPQEFCQHCNPKAAQRPRRRSMVVEDVYEDGEAVAVEFDDGHKAIFVPYRHGWGYQVEGLRHFFLYRGEGEVAAYDSRLHRAAPLEDEHRLVHATDGYTPQRIAEYWAAARSYLQEEYFNKPFEDGREKPEELWYAWRVVAAEGGMDLERLQRGQTAPIAQ